MRLNTVSRLHPGRAVVRAREWDQPWADAWTEASSHERAFLVHAEDSRRERGGCPERMAVDDDRVDAFAVLTSPGRCRACTSLAAQSVTECSAGSEVIALHPTTYAARYVSDPADRRNISRRQCRR